MASHRRSCYSCSMNPVHPFAEMPTHDLNDLNAALWLVFFAAWVIITLALQLVKHNRPPHWARRS